MAEIVALTHLLRHLHADAGRPLALRDGRVLTTGDFMRRVGAWQAAFAATAGQRFALHEPDSFEFAAALLGGWHAGKTLYLPGDTLAATLQALSPRVDGMAGALPGGLQPLSQAPDDVASAALVAQWDALDAQNIRLVLFTSGSSGDPAAIGKNMRQLDSEIATLEACFGHALDGVLIQGTVSHQHIYGLLFRVLWPLASGRPFACEQLEYPEQIAALDPARAVALVASPAMLKRLPETMDWSSARAALRVVFSSGGPLPGEARAAVERLWGHAVVEVFGSTETGGIATRSTGAEPWRPLPGVAVRMDDTVLWVRSRHLAGDDWFRTADNARSVGDGFVLLGRGDRLVKLEERRISLDAIEQALRADAWIADARVLLLAGARDRIVAAIVLSRQGHEVLSSSGRKRVIERLRGALRPQVDAIAIPKLWRFVDALPVNSQGKTTQQQLAALFQSDRPFTQWLERGANAARLTMDIGGNLAVCDGHFPDLPILPGVAMLDWAIAHARDAFGISQPFLRMEALKFQQLARPDIRLELALDWRPETGTMQFCYESAQGRHASGRIVFAAQAPSA